MFFKEILLSYLKKSISNNIGKLLIAFWLILCASLSFVVGGITKQTVEKLYDVKYKKMDAINRVFFDLNSQTYQICYENKEISDVLQLSNMTLIRDKPFSSNKGVILIEQSKRILNCSIEQTLEINPCPSAWRTAEHCYLQGESNMLKLFKKNREPKLIEYHSKGTEEINIDQLIYLPAAVILDAFIVPFTLFWRALMYTALIRQ